MGENLILIGKLTILFLLFVSFGVTSAFAVVLSPVDSLHFDNSDDANFVIKGNSLITSQENPSLQLNGIGDYLILDSNLPEKLNTFSVSVCPLALNASARMKISNRLFVFIFIFK